MERETPNALTFHRIKRETKEDKRRGKGEGEKKRRGYRDGFGDPLTGLDCGGYCDTLLSPLSSLFVSLFSSLLSPLSSLLSPLSSLLSPLSSLLSLLFSSLLLSPLSLSSSPLRRSPLFFSLPLLYKQYEPANIGLEEERVGVQRQTKLKCT